MIFRGTDVCPLLSSPLNSALAADATTCLRILYPVWIGPFDDGRRLDLFPGWLVVSQGNSSLQCGCVPMAPIGIMNHCKCEVSYR